MFPLLSSDSIMGNFFIARKRQKKARTSVSNSGRSNISLLFFLFHALGYRLKLNPSNTRHCLENSETQWTQEYWQCDKGVNNGPLHSSLPPLLSLSSVQVQMSSSFLCFCLLYLPYLEVTPGIFCSDYILAFFANILRTSSYHRIQVLFFSLFFFSSPLPIVILYSSPHKRYSLGLLVASKQDKWILINNLIIPTLLTSITIICQDVVEIL